MVSGSKFDLDLAEGKIGEEFVKALLLGRITVEVKTDKEFHGTANLFIEVGKHDYDTGEKVKSGLSVTEAKYHAFVLPDVGKEPPLGILIMRTDALKAAVRRSAKQGGMKPRKGGDGKRAIGYTLRPEHLMAEIRRIYNGKIKEISQQRVGGNVGSSPDAGQAG